MNDINKFFDLSFTEHKKLFEGVEHPWEVIPKIKDYLNGKTYIDETAKVSEQATILGPCYIGKNVEIRPGAFIRENVIVGDGSVVGNSTELKNCFIFQEAQLPHFNYIGDSVIGHKAHFGAGAIISNTKIPMSEIIVRIHEKEYKTGLEKFGAIIGDNTEVGSNAVINPGSVMGKNCMIYPLVSFRGVIEDNIIVKLRQVQEMAIKK